MYFLLTQKQKFIGFIKKCIGFGLYPLALTLHTGKTTSGMTGRGCCFVFLVREVGFQYIAGLLNLQQSNQIPFRAAPPGSGGYDRFLMRWNQIFGPLQQHN